MNKTFDLKIINKNDYKIYHFDIKIDKTTNNGFLPTLNDIHTWMIMTENFLNNCKKNNIRFGFIFNLNNLNSIDVIHILEVCKFLLKYKNILKSFLIGNCIIMNNNTIESFINLFLKYYTPVKPLKICKDINECYEFIEECKENNNLSYKNLIK